jgi:hypothetical protein
VDRQEDVLRCFECDSELSESFRFCPHCAAPQRSKLVEYFRGHPLIETDPVGLRVSRYLGDDRHIRLSIWYGDHASAVIALEEYEARRLAAFLSRRVELPETPSLVDRLLAHVDELVGRRPA